MSVMVPGGEEGVVVPADVRAEMALSQAIGTPAASPTAASPAPAAAPPQPRVDAVPEPDATTRDTIAALNANMLAIVERLERGPAPAAEPAAPAAPDPMLALLNHPDEEVRALAQRQIDLQARLDRVEATTQGLETQSVQTQAQQFEAQLNNEAKIVADTYGLTQPEMAAVLDRWGTDCERDPRLSILSVEEAARRYHGAAALDARRAARPAAPGEGLVPAPPQPRTARPAPRMVTESASGGGREGRAVINGNMSNADISRLVMKERFGS